MDCISGSFCLVLTTSSPKWVVCFKNRRSKCQGKYWVYFRGVLQFIVLQLCSSWCFFLKKISIMTCLLQMEFSFGCLARLVVGFHLVISSLFLLSFCTCYSYNPHFMSTVSGCFNSFKQLQCLLFLSFESKRIINYSSLMSVWNFQSNSFPFVHLSCFSHCVGMLISNLNVVMPLIGVE